MDEAEGTASAKIVKVEATMRLRLASNVAPLMIVVGVGVIHGERSAAAATIAPPMLDIAHQCNQATRHNATAMSECVVAESEARADLLQHWGKLSNDAVDRCIKIGRKAKRQPYVAMEKCLSPELAGPAPAMVDDNKK